MRYSNFNSEKLSTMMAMINGAYTVNSITNKTTYDRETGVQTTMPVNVNGVWNLSGSLMFNYPLGSHFQINSSSNASYDHNVGYLRTGSTSDLRGPKTDLNSDLFLSLYSNVCFSYQTA